MATTHATTAPAADPEASLLTVPVLSWSLYDLANTIFSMSIVSLYMQLWVVNVMGGSDAMWGYANSVSMLLILLTSPLLGALSDQTGRRLPLLLACTLVCVAFTALLGLGGLMLSLVFFVVANYFFQAGVTLYEATLPLVSTPANRGRVVGLGVGLGYVGSFLVVGIGLLLLESIGYANLFRVTALLFLIFALPIFLFVREPSPAPAARVPLLRAARGAAAQVAATLRNVGRYPGLGRFLVGRALYADAANTVIIFMGVYVTNEVGFTTREAQILLLVAIAAATLGGFTVGRVVDRVGPKLALNAVLVLWMVALAGAILVAVAELPKELFWGVASLAGVALGGTWTADRPYLLLLAPPERIGEFYGLYGMVGRFAAVVGPALWAFIADTLGLGRPAAIGSLLVMVVAGFLVLQGVDDRPLAAPALPEP